MSMPVPMLNPFACKRFMLAQKNKLFGNERFLFGSEQRVLMIRGEMIKAFR
jgi:hypothetical protein